MGARDMGLFPFHNTTRGRMIRYGKYDLQKSRERSKPMKDAEGIINCGNCEHWQNVQFKGKGVCALSKQHGKKIFCACALFTDKEFCCVEHKKLSNEN